MIFKFNMGEVVQIVCSGEVGQIVARAEYVSGNRQYLLRYKAGDGRAVEAWWDQEAVGYYAA